MSAPLWPALIALPRGSAIASPRVRWGVKIGGPVLAVCVTLAVAAPALGATLKVNTTADGLALHDGKCSLREAIASVNSPGRRTDCGLGARRANTILLPAGRYILSIARSGGDGNATGDLDIAGGTQVTVLGAGMGRTVITASGLGDRLLSVARTADVRLAHLTITGGHAPDGSTGTGGVGCPASSGRNGQDGGSAASGGGIYNNGTLILHAVAIIANTAGAGGRGGNTSAHNGAVGCGGGNGGAGGGIYNTGRLAVTDSLIAQNSGGRGGAGGTGSSSSTGPAGPGGPGGAGGSGGGIYNLGTLSVTASTLDKNESGPGGAGGAGGEGVAVAGGDGHGGSGASGGAIFSTHGTLRMLNSTLVGNLAGPGGNGGGSAGSGGAGGDGGGIEVAAGRSDLLDVTVADNQPGAGGTSGAAGGNRGTPGSGGGVFVDSPRRADDMGLQNTIVASNGGSDCGGNTASAIANLGHDLSYGDMTCLGGHGNPKLGRLEYNGGLTDTLALGRGSAAIDRVPPSHGHCPPTDQRGVHRPQGRACDIGAFEFALPTITVDIPKRHASYERGSRIRARFTCREGGITSPIASCRGTVPRGHAIGTRFAGRKRFTVTAIDRTGNRVKTSVHYTVWAYADPLRAVGGLTAERIDMGVDYAGSGPLLALGDGRVTMASDHDSGPLSCWGKSCWPGGGIVVYRLTEGPFAGKYVYVAENISVRVRKGQRVRTGQPIATLHSGSPNMETGWASGHGAETLAFRDGHQCPCGDPGGWLTIEGRNFDHLLTWLGAPSGYLQPNPPAQRMPHGWPRLPPR